MKLTKNLHKPYCNIHILFLHGIYFIQLGIPIDIFREK